MANYTQTELSSIREVAACHINASIKLNTYSEQCQDAQIKQMFKQAAMAARGSAQTLIQLL